MDVGVAVTCNFHEGVDVFEGVPVVELCVICVEVVVDIVLVDISQRCSEQCEEDRPEYRSLWNSTGESGKLGLNAIHQDSLKTVSEVGSKPRKCRVVNSKGVLKTGKKDGVRVSYGVNCGG